MAKITDFTTPTGQHGNLFNIGDWAKIILGAFVFLIGFAMGQNLVQRITGKVPFIDTTIDPIVYQPQATTKKMYL
jgi:hypothetical protein